jgi:GNAT superfamily N-acetyltransferase
MVREFDFVTDLTQVLDMAAALHQESPEHRALPFDRAYLTASLHAPYIKGFVYERDGELRGYAFGAIVRTLFGPGAYCADVSLYVRPPYRTGFIALKLIKRREAWGKSMGALRHQAAISTGLRGAQGLYQALGYQSTGGCYSKAV